MRGHICVINFVAHGETKIVWIDGEPAKTAPSKYFGPFRYASVYWPPRGMYRFFNGRPLEPAVKTRRGLAHWTYDADLDLNFDQNSRYR